MAADPTFRTLTALKGASTSRVLNLLAIGLLHGAEGGFQENPLFNSPVLNNAIIVKHRLRANEYDLFLSPRAVGTKVIIPFEKSDLRNGGQSFMVGQRGYKELVRDAGNYNSGRNIDHDLHVLNLLDRIPSLDPFLLREHLRCHGISADSRYFEISDNDRARMFDFTAQQLKRLTSMAGQGRNGATSRLVIALLSSEVDEKLEPLRITLQIGEEEFREGVFSWRGFLYYKWSLEQFWPSLIKSLRQLKVIKFTGPADHEQIAFINSTRQAILLSAKRSSDDIKNILAVYDKAYDGMIFHQNAKEFRNFLLNAPSLFLEIGGKMGALSHITSFWGYRFPDRASALVDATELAAIFHDFSNSFVFEQQQAA